MPADSTSPNKMVTGIGITIVVGGLAFGLLSCWQKAERLQADIVELDQTKTQASLDAKKLVDLTHQAELLEAQVRDYDRLVPDNKNLGEFLGQLSSELETAGLQNTAVKAQTATLLGRCERLPIEVHGMGTYEQIHHFLERLESMPRKSSVSRLSVEVADPAMSGIVTMDLTLSIYSTQQK